MIVIATHNGHNFLKNLLWDISPEYGNQGVLSFLIGFRKRFFVEFYEYAKANWDKMQFEHMLKLFSLQIYKNGRSTKIEKDEDKKLGRSVRFFL